MGGTLAHLPGRLADVARSTIAGTPRGRNDPVSIVGVGRLGGEITSSNLPGLNAAVKLRLLVALLAAVNPDPPPLAPLPSGRRLCGDGSQRIGDEGAYTTLDRCRFRIRRASCGSSRTLSGGRSARGLEGGDGPGSG